MHTVTSVWTLQTNTKIAEQIATWLKFLNPDPLLSISRPSFSIEGGPPNWAAIPSIYLAGPALSACIATQWSSPRS